MPRKAAGRAANGAGSIRKINRVVNGKTYTYWQARYTDTRTGKQHSITAKTQAEVRTRLTEVQFDIDMGKYIEPSKQTLGEWLDLWLETYVSVSVKPYTLDSYRTQVNVHIKPQLGKITLASLNTLQVQQFYSRLLSSGMSPKTIRNVNGVLHKALNQAIKVGIMRYNPTDACELPKVIKKEIKPLEQQDIRKFVEAFKGTRFENIYLVTLFTGLRQGEVLGLTWDCVDFKRESIYVNKQLQKTKKVGGSYTLVPTKNGRARLITVAPFVIQILKDQLATQTQLKTVAGSAWDNRDNLVFTDEIGTHLVHLTVYKEFKEIAHSLGYESARFHDLRHSYAVAAIESGDDIKTVQCNLGHATASFTLDVYGHASARMRQRSAENMQRFISEVFADENPDLFQLGRN